MLLKLRKGESERREEYYEVQGLIRGERGGEPWEDLFAQEFESLTLDRARELVAELQRRNHPRIRDGVRIVRTILESKVVE